MALGGHDINRRTNEVGFDSLNYLNHRGHRGHRGLVVGEDVFGPLLCVVESSSQSRRDLRQATRFKQRKRAIGSALTDDETPVIPCDPLWFK